MYLVLDFGNTLYKTALFKDNELIKYQEFRDLDTETLGKFAEDFVDITGAIISSVRDYDPSLNEFIEAKVPLLKLDYTTKIPVANNYKTPATLGKDRIALAVAAHHTFPDREALVIDAGTCITYDFVNRRGEYFGGSISPGIQTRFRSLATFTDHLPLLEYKEDVKLIGGSTEESMLSGVINGTLAEIDGIIDKYKSIFPDIMVLISGGEAIYFDKKLKNNIFAVQNLVLKGLNLILRYNFEE